MAQISIQGDDHIEACFRRIEQRFIRQVLKASFARCPYFVVEEKALQFLRHIGVQEDSHNASRLLGRD